MQFIAVFLATLAGVAFASSTEEKRSCIANYDVACHPGGTACCDGWQCVGATHWNAGVCIPHY
ncbi:uncharacterized protein N7484_008685 [Penicillium longicatenatum]|uniref:uncharacterized protein n=1 Tax=Penicillium longicatenatum TaxID=1561947 RepID=UPI002547EE74|nr:uncharacterized protein N7484_008685 [Penicillium longicatenatum]KAJ5635372.1 hypothetical protein N7484_008685 [Penicillium longicatenatum]KAJ5655562.1 hypothetical protein N7507_007512 [Penicillium longicatenatum]